MNTDEGSPGTGLGVPSGQSRLPTDNAIMALYFTGNQGKAG